MISPHPDLTSGSTDMKQAAAAPAKSTSSCEDASVAKRDQGGDSWRSLRRSESAWNLFVLDVILKSTASRQWILLGFACALTPLVQATRLGLVLLEQRLAAYHCCVV
uniref:Uncharacterized protein n=1 Tax=Oryza barthii TaxID=65489 RepID=A0A0D3GL77_9ORYZ